jgi:hypothetical protein
VNGLYYDSYLGGLVSCLFPKNGENNPVGLRTIAYKENSRTIFHRYYGKMMGVSEPDPKEPERGG